jgi:hypothetical protein
MQTGRVGRITKQQIFARQALEARTFVTRTDGPSIDPRVFKLVCVPCDVYVRVSRERDWDWGSREVWTHFDGHQLSTTGNLRSLVGGDVRYGGCYDLVSIARDDEREKVITRFAVVRRERMANQFMSLIQSTVTDRSLPENGMTSSDIGSTSAIRTTKDRGPTS